MIQPRFMLAGCASGSGKTTITCGLIRALMRRGLRVSSFKCGPDYIDPMFHSRMLGADSRNLDTFFTGRETTRYLFARGAKGTDISVMEGVMGYYDGMGLTSLDASSADLAEVTETPVILVVNVRGMSLSVLAQIKGFLEFKRPTQIRGVILNQASAMTYQGLAEAIERELHVRALGYVPRMPEMTLESRHLGLVLPDEVEGLQKSLDALADVLEKTLDIEGILALSRTEVPEVSDQVPEHIRETLESREAEEIRRVRPVVAVARDEAFCFIYEDNLRLLRELGARLQEFSPVHDRTLSREADGLLLYGGYPELCAGELSENTAMRGSIRQAVREKRMPCMAECGGFMYLHERMEDMEGQLWPMAGALDGEVRRTDHLVRFGYIGLEARQEGILGEGLHLKGHEFHYFESSDCGESFLAKKPSGKRSWNCIHGSENGMMGFPHLYYYAEPRIALDFLRRCAKYQNT